MDELLLLRQLLLRCVRDARGGGERVRAARLCPHEPVRRGPLQPSHQRARAKGQLVRVRVRIRGRGR